MDYHHPMLKLRLVVSYQKLMKLKNCVVVKQKRQKKVDFQRWKLNQTEHETMLLELVIQIE